MVKVYNFVYILILIYLYFDCIINGIDEYFRLFINVQWGIFQILILGNKAIL